MHGMIYGMGLAHHGMFPFVLLAFHVILVSMFALRRVNKRREERDAGFVRHHKLLSPSSSSSCMCVLCACGEHKLEMRSVKVCVRVKRKGRERERESVIDFQHEVLIRL